MSKSNNYDRRFEILINDKVFIKQSGIGEKQFRVVFDNLIDFGGFTSYMDLSIYNLTLNTRGKIFKRDTKITLRAGYEATIDTIFSGRISNIFVERDGADIVTRLVARGGSVPTTNINVPLGKNVSIVDIIRRCVKAMGYAILIQEEQFTDITLYSRGYTLKGNPYAELNELARVHGFSFVVESDRVVVVRNVNFRPGVPTEVSRFTGMEGIPKIGAFNSNNTVEIDVDIRLNPKIRIGGRINVKSELVTFTMGNVYYNKVPANNGQGVYKVTRIRHQGDSWGALWTSSVTGLRA